MLTQVIKTIRTLLPFTGSITQQQIEDAVNNVMMIPLYAGFDKDFLIREIEALYNIRINDFRIIEASERKMPWINAEKASIKWNFWNRYISYLQKKIAPDTINKLDNLTDDILDRIANPTTAGTHQHSHHFRTIQYQHRLWANK